MAGPTMVREYIKRIRSTQKLPEFDTLFRKYCGHPLPEYNEASYQHAKRAVFLRARELPFVDGYRIQEVANLISHAIQGCYNGTWKAVESDLELLEGLVTELDST
jgi:hypothetical protein